jgi:hypothetical protein
MRRQQSITPATSAGDYAARMRIAIALLLGLASSAHADDRGQLGGPPHADDRGQLGGPPHADDRGQLGGPPRADDYGWLGPPEPFEPRIDPATARWVSLATTAAGLGLSAYLWHHADDLPEDNGRTEMQLTSIGTGLATIGIGPAAGLLAAGEYRRSVSGALARPLLIGGGAITVGVGAFIVLWGCFETNDCAGAKVGGGMLGGAGVLMAAGGIAWAAYDIWDTPHVLRRRMPKHTALVPVVGSDRVGVALTITH